MLRPQALDLVVLKKEVHDLPDNVHKSRESCEVLISQPEAPLTAKQLEKPPQHLNCLNGKESRRLARAALKEVYGTVAQRAATP